MPYIVLRWQDIPDILIVAFIIYKVLMLFAGTRAMQLFRGIMIIAVIGALANVFEFRTLSWLIGRLLGAFIIIIPILFQPELRRILEELGKGRIANVTDEDKIDKRAKQLTDALVYCKEHKIGAICVLQRNTNLKEIWRTAVTLDADLTNELLVSIFWPGTPLHDGAVVINRDKVIAAGCYLPLSEKTNLSRWYGTRHRAALGITEVSDALAIVVSEERGEVTIAVSGRLSKPMNETQLLSICRNYFESAEDADTNFMPKLQAEALEREAK